jgi:excisionase family DNA binding protein
MVQILTVSAVAEELGYSVQHVRRLIREGTLTAVKIGRDWMIESESVAAFLQHRDNLILPLDEPIR